MRLQKPSFIPVSPAVVCGGRARVCAHAQFSSVYEGGPGVGWGGVASLRAMTCDRRGRNRDFPLMSVSPRRPTTTGTDDQGYRGSARVAPVSVTLGFSSRRTDASRYKQYIPRRHAANHLSYSYYIRA